MIRCVLYIWAEGDAIMMVWTPAFDDRLNRNLG
jgi:hypothetical protein